MISYDRSSARTPWVWGAAVAAGVVLAAVIWWQRGTDDAASGPMASAPAASGVTVPQRLAPEPMIVLDQPAPVLSDGRPAEFTQDEWQALQDTVAKGPNAAAELKRVTAYMRFQKAFTQWQSEQETNRDPKVRKAMAEQLLAAVPERLKQSEVTIGEALMLGAALYNDIEPDEAARSARLDQFRIKLEAVAPRTDNAAEMREANCLAEYKRREALIQQDFISRPDAQRDHKKFESDLDAAHRAVYEGVDCK
ncbi:MAG: hypothetical protein RJB60_2065 [Pseudomonadota bacterium]|jgi:hypothetical protein